MPDPVRSVDHPRVAQTLQRYFGFDGLRPGQTEALDHVLSGKDALVVMPTGAGKSLVYQLAALLKEGTTVVLSPLIALMKDQVDALQARGIAACAVNSSMPESEQRATLDEISKGTYKLVYAAPERLRSRAFLRAIAQSDLALLAVDEAHCVSQWGHDFRPDYLRIGQARQQFSEAGSAQCIGLTATATEIVQDDIAGSLHLTDPARVVTGFDRPNLLFNVQSAPTAADKRDALRALIGDGQAGGATLVYVQTRKQADSVARYLAEHYGGGNVGVYHAGLPDAERERAQNDFIQKRTDIVVATNAFGMGVDRADVRRVVHWALPATMEAYYQEAGRAGRDGLPADVLLLYAPTDRQLRQWFIDQAAPEESSLKRLHRRLQSKADGGPVEIGVDQAADLADLHPVGARTALGLLERMGAIHRLDGGGDPMRVEVHAWDERRAGDVLHRLRQHRDQKVHGLEQMSGYAETDGCRRQLLVGHFGDHVEPGTDPARCCDACATQDSLPEVPDEKPEFDQMPMNARIALGLLDLVARLRWSVGRKTLVKILTGSKAEGMDKYERLPYFGRLGTYNQKTVDGFYKQLLREGYLKVGGEYSTVELAPLGRHALEHRLTIDLKTTRPASPNRASLTSTSGEGTGTIRRTRVVQNPSDALTPDDAPLFEALRQWRTAEAKERAVPPYVVFADRVLAAIAQTRPQSEADLLAISGIGPAKNERYGEAVLALVAEAEGQTA